jgi:hypothetical protein
LPDASITDAGLKEGKRLSLGARFCFRSAPSGYAPAEPSTPNRNVPQGGPKQTAAKITPLDAAVPEAAQQMIDQTAMMLPHVKITELLLEVDAWTGFTGHFTHLKTGEIAK